MLKVFKQYKYHVFCSLYGIILMQMKRMMMIMSLVWPTCSTCITVYNDTMHTVTSGLKIYVGI